MVFEALLTYAMLAWGAPLVVGEPVPMAVLLAIITGLLAFIPNLGAITSGILMTLVGFSGGVNMGIYTVVVYFVVQNFDGYIVVPMIARQNGRPRASIGPGDASSSWAFCSACWACCSPIQCWP